MFRCEPNVIGGMTAGRAVPSAGQVVETAGLRGRDVVLLLALTCDCDADGANMNTRQPARNEIRTREERVANIDFPPILIVGYISICQYKAENHWLQSTWLRGLTHQLNNLMSLPIYEEARATRFEEL